jgi:phosphotransferase system enzyme I (PtsI)
MKKIKGKPVSSGIVFGKALLFNCQNKVIFKENIKKDLIHIEIERFDNAVKKTRAQLKKIYNDLEKIMEKSSALIIETQYLLLKDENLIDEIKNLITSNSVRAEWAIKQVDEKYIDFFDNISDITFREKRSDISDVLNRLIRNLKKSEKQIDSDIGNVILVSDDIPPSIAAKLMSRTKLLGIILNEGGETSHTVILARTLEIPTILDTKNATEIIKNDDFLIVDGLKGEIIINPSNTILDRYYIKRKKYQAYKEKLDRVIQLPDMTKDKKQFNLLANIELATEISLVQSHGAKGIGLYRTEFLFSDESVALSANKQYMIYKSIAQEIFPDPLTIRTFDVGRDKNYNYFKSVKEGNPALGKMAVRLFLKEEKLFRTQIKAILRANESGNIKILFPMITEIEEIHSIKKIIYELKNELKMEKKLPGKEVEIGIMIEIPGAVKIIKYLKEEIDFFSIGTNDLIQYLLAVDRNNSSVSYLFSPFHPAVIQVLFEIKHEISRIGKDVVVCGEMAGRALTALMLLGMGFTNFSMSPLSIIEIKKIFTKIDYNYVKEIVKQLVNFSLKTDTERFLKERLQKKYPDLFVEQPGF